MYQLQQGEQFPIVHLLGDPTDTGTYYVRAVIRDPIANTTVETVDLTDRTGGTFSKNYSVPSGHRYLTITKSVYTDSGYTTLAPTYPISSDLYLIEQRWSRAAGGVGGGGGDISTSKIRAIVQEEIKPFVEFEKRIEEKLVMFAEAVQNIAPPKAVSLTPLESLVSELIAKVDAIGQNKPVTALELNKAIKSLRDAFTAAERSILDSIPPEAEPVEPMDMSPVYSQINDLRNAFQDSISKLREDFKKSKEIVLRVGEAESPPSINSRVQALM